MNGQKQREFMYLFERVGEPLYMSPRGSDNYMYNVPMEHVPSKMQHAAMTMRTSITSTMKTVNVRKPKWMPDLGPISRNCPRNSIFCYFNPSHRKAAMDLKEILTEQPSDQELMATASACRDSPMINPQLFVHALAGCLLHRRDMRGFNIPAYWEIMPDQFMPAQAIKQAERMAHVPPEDRTPIIINRDTTGHERDPEHRLWYFREDVGVNSHHYHWHIVYPSVLSPNQKQQDRRGEIFYNAHHFIMNRYDAERLCNGLSRVKPFNFDNPVIEVGYFSKMYSTNAGMNWGSRQANTRIQNLEMRQDSDGVTTNLRIEDLKKWRDRIYDAIDTGYIIRRLPNGKDVREKLDEITGVDVLGEIIENSASATPHPQYYGPDGFHNMGHVILALSHDPKGKHREQPGPMGDTSTSLRDPVFYIWHKYVDDMFLHYKATLPPYKPVGGTLPLVWKGIEVTDVVVEKHGGQSKPNELTTFWMRTDIDLARGVDFGRSNENQLGSVLVRATHLNYDSFDYIINVENRQRSTVTGTVRIYMAPRHDEHGVRFRMEDQHALFFELDKFEQELKPGTNKIVRKSTDSATTIQWQNSFSQLENLTRDTVRPIDSRCGCGWPQHLLIPKGTSAGKEFDLFVMVTNGADDKVAGSELTRDGDLKPDCREAMSFCGVLDAKYPDSKPMGYPFDRKPFKIRRDNSAQEATVENLDEYVTPCPNMKTVIVKIIHQQDRVEDRFPEMNEETVTMEGEIQPPMKQTDSSKRPTEEKKPTRPSNWIPPKQIRPPQNPWNGGWSAPPGSRNNPWKNRFSVPSRRKGRDLEHEGSPEEEWDYVDDDDEPQPYRY